MSGFVKKITEHNRTAVIAIVITIIAISGVISLRLFSEGGLGPDGAAFGKLPAMNRLNAPETSFALGVPARQGGQEMIVAQEYEYSWVGGSYPDMQKVEKVYRRINSEMDLDEIKKLAKRFGFNDEPLDTPVAVQGEPISDSKVRGNLITPEIGADPKNGERSSSSELNIYRFSDVEKNAYLEIYGRDGRFFFENILTEAGDGRFPGKKESISIAKIFLKEVGLDQKGLSDPIAIEGGIILDASVSITSNEDEHLEITRGDPTFMEVVFHRAIDGNKIHDGFEGEGYRSISIMVGKGGNIISASGDLAFKIASSDYPLIDIKTAFKKIENGDLGPIGNGLPEPALREGPDSYSSLISEPAPKDLESESVGSHSAASEVVTATVVADSLLPVDDMPLKEPAQIDNPDIDAPKMKREIISIELDTVELIYTTSFDVNAQVFYRPAYLFSGKVKGSKQKRQIQVDAIEDKYLDT